MRTTAFGRVGSSSNEIPTRITTAKQAAKASAGTSACMPAARASTSSRPLLTKWDHGFTLSRFLIQGDAPVAYLRMDELSPDTGTYMNLGELRNTGSLVLNNKVQRNTTSALSNEWNDASIGSHRRNGAGTRANIPFTALNNPPESQALTIETWVRALNDRVTPGAAILNNRKASGNRSGWVIFQRDPNSTYTGVPSSE